MTETQSTKHYDLEDRTYRFAERVRDYSKKLPRNITNIEYGTQLVRSSGSVAANYIEANESLSKKDFCMRIKICRKETKENRLWLKLTEPNTENQGTKGDPIKEGIELTKIFGAIVENSQ